MDHWPEQLRAVWGDSLDDLRAEIEEARRLERLRERERLRAEAFFRGSGGGGQERQGERYLHVLVGIVCVPCS